MLLYVEPGYSTGMTVIPVPMTDQLRYVTSVCVCVSMAQREYREANRHEVVARGSRANEI